VVKYGEAKVNIYPDHLEPWKKLLKATKKPEYLNNIFRLAKELHWSENNTPRDTETLWRLYNELSKKLLPEVPPDMTEEVMTQEEAIEAGEMWIKAFEDYECKL
jgi:hypothetical protein